MSLSPDKFISALPSDVEIAARGMCQASTVECVCQFGRECVALECYGPLAEQAINALRKRRRMLVNPS